MRILLAALALGAAAPALAQAQTAPGAVATPDPARLAAARPVIDKLWPLGTYRRMMDGTLSKMMDQMMSSMFNMKASDLGAPGGKAGDKSLGELAQGEDPHFRERMKITMDVMTAEMIPLMEKMEPTIRDSLARVYAGRFTVGQLNDMSAFFSTPTGSAYADQAMLLMMDPEVMTSIQGFLPELMRAMPAIMAKTEAATKHLPPPPKKK